MQEYPPLCPKCKNPLEERYGIWDGATDTMEVMYECGSIYNTGSGLRQSASCKREVEEKKP